MKKILSITALTFYLSGCVSFQPYPDSWSVVNAGGKYPKFQGKEFACEGKAVTDGGVEIDTTIYDFIDFDPINGIVCNNFSVSITKFSDLEITLGENGSPSAQKVVFAQNEYKIVDGWIHLPKKREILNKEGVLAYTSGKKMLGVTENGSLVIKSKGLGAGLMLLIPVVGVGNNWARFEKI